MNKLKSTCLIGLAIAGLAIPSATANASQQRLPPLPIVGEAFTSQVLTDVRLQHADVFSNANLSDDGILTIEITEDLKVGADLAAKLATAGGQVKFKVVEGPTDKIKRDAIEAVASVFYSQPGVGPGITTYDEPTERVVASYEPTGLADVIPGPSEVLGIPVVYEVSKVAPPEMAVMSGGTQLTFTSPYSFSPACTAGFTGTRNGVVGIITADHCSDVMGYESRDILRKQVNATRSRGDAEFHSTTQETIWNQYVVDFSNNQFVRKQIRRTSFTDVGYNVCVFGQKTKGTKCAKVIDFRASITYRDPNDGSLRFYGNLVVTGTRGDGGPPVVQGDSGGPWWLLDDVSAGVGITSGEGGYNANNVYCQDNCAYFSDLISVSSDMGVAVKVN